MSQAHAILTPDDDRLHPPPDPLDPMWTESYYFGFDLEERALSFASYPLFRQNLGIWSLGLHLWDSSGVAPWEAPYSRFLWHLPLGKDADLTDFEGAGLRYRTLEPLMRYHVGFQDPGRLALELEFTGLRPPHANWAQVDAKSQASGKGHFDQDMHVQGEMLLNGERIAVDAFGHRDRSWYSRPDTGARRSVSVSFAITAAEQWLVLRPRVVNGEEDAQAKVEGYLVRDGVWAEIHSAERRVTQRFETRAQHVEITATDALGRTIQAQGRAANSFAFNTSPPILAWFSQFGWETSTGRMLGEDQETYSFAEIGGLIRAARAVV